MRAICADKTYQIHLSRSTQNENSSSTDTVAETVASLRPPSYRDHTGRRTASIIYIPPRDLVSTPLCPATDLVSTPSLCPQALGLYTSSSNFPGSCWSFLKFMTVIAMQHQEKSLIGGGHLTQLMIGHWTLHSKSSSLRRFLRY